MRGSKLSGGAVIGLLAAVLAVGGAVWYVMSGTDGAPVRPGEPFVATNVKQRVAKPAVDVKKRPNKRKVLSAAAVEKLRPNLDLESADEAKLSAKMLEIYRDLQDALDKEDRKRVFALVHKLQSMDEWPDGIPFSVKKRALDALAWFGAPALPEAIGFLEDSSQEVRDAAVETFKEQLADNWDQGDAELANMLVSISKLNLSVDAFDTFYEQLDSMHMRPSERAKAVKEIYSSGSENAQKALDQNLESIFMNDDVQVKERTDVDKALTAAVEKESDETVKKELDEQYGKWSW